MVQILKAKKSYTNAVERAVADYYSSLPSEESEEQARWSKFALDEFRFRTAMRKHAVRSV
jgi:hypothetical protein